jgi:hypothetical protein
MKTPCAVVSCDSRDAMPYPLKTAGRTQFWSLCRRHERLIRGGLVGWSTDPDFSKRIFIDDSSEVTSHRGNTPVFVLEGVDSSDRTSDRLPGTDEPVVRLLLSGYWPNHNLPETFEIMVSEQMAAELRASAQLH